MPNKTTPLEMADSAVKLGQTMGLTAIEVHIDGATQQAVAWESKATTSAASLPPKDSLHADIRVYSSIGQVGISSGACGSKGAIQRLIDKAIEAAKASGGDPHAGPAEYYEQSNSGLGLMDRRVGSLEDEQREEAVNDNIDDARSVNGVEPVSFRYIEEVRRRAFASSTGVRRDEASSRFRLEGCVALDDDTLRVSGSVESRLFADAASLPLGADLAAQIRRYRSPEPVSSDQRPIVFEPAVAAAIVRAVLPAFARGSVESGDSFLSASQQVGTDKLHMIDDGLVPSGLNTRSFDLRGVPSLAIPLIREGAVGAMYQSVEQARARNGRPSGHEGRQSVMPGNLVLRPGTRSRNMIAPDLGRYLIFDALSETGRGWFNLKTGKLKLTGHLFSAVAGEEPTYAGVRTISTTFIDLWSGIREVANDQKRFGCIDVSSWVVEGLTLS